MNIQVRTAPGVGGTIVVLAAWCRDCRQEAMPDREGRCGFCGRPIVDEHTLKASDAIASTNTIGKGGPMAATRSSRRRRQSTR